MSDYRGRLVSLASLIGYKKPIFVLVCSIVVVSLVWFASEWIKPGGTPKGFDSSARSQTEVAIKNLSDGRIQISDYFPGPGGLEGLVLSDGGMTRTVAFATPDGKFIIIGAIYGPGNENLSAKYLQAYASDANPEATKARAAALAEAESKARESQQSYVNIPSGEPKPWGQVVLSDEQVELLKSLKGIPFGKGGQAAWLIADPLCGACKAMYRALNAKPAAGLSQDYSFQIILAGGVGGEMGKRLSALVLDKKLSLDDAFNAGPELLGQIRNESATLESGIAVDRASRLLASIDSRVPTPLLIVKDAQGKYQTRVLGPDEYAPQKSAIAGAAP